MGVEVWKKHVLYIEIQMIKLIKKFFIYSNTETV